MSHDEIPNSHVNTSDLSPVDAIGYVLGVALPATVETITARIERLLASERELQRASERIAELESQAAEIVELAEKVSTTMHDMGTMIALLRGERDRALASLGELRGGK